MHVLLTVAVAAALGQDPEYLKEIDSWHARRMEKLRSNTGYLTLVGLHQLNPGTHTLGSGSDNGIILDSSAPVSVGQMTISGDTITFTAQTGVTVQRFGSTAPERISTTTMIHDMAGAPTVLSTGSILFHVIQRNDTLYLRVRNRNSPALASFKGIERYAVNARWRIPAKLSTDEAGTILVPNVLGKKTATASPGVLVFEFDGTLQRLHPTRQTNGSLFMVFRDATSGETTYPGGRFLEAPAPDDDGRVVLDFNRAHNPACAFTPFATCPMPPAGNALSIAVEAGEKYTPH